MKRSFKNIFPLFFFISSIINYAQNAWGSEVFLSVNEEPLSYVLNEIRSQSNLNIIYSDKIINDKKVTCNLSSTAEDAIKEVLTKTGFSYKKFENNVAVIFPKSPSSKKTKAVVRNKNVKSNFSPPNEEVLKPTLISSLELAYPENAIKERIEGEVHVLLLVSKSGNVTNVKVKKSSGHEILDTATINYIKKLKFLPAEVNGKYHPVWTSMLVKYNFE
ncbi:MAG: TonB family protein [Melioribacteraceae bacterium]|nr:TonB family protein [Melioribacteraceae bacterium]